MTRKIILLGFITTTTVHRTPASAKRKPRIPPNSVWNNQHQQQLEGENVQYKWHKLMARQRWHLLITKTTQNKRENHFLEWSTVWVRIKCYNDVISCIPSFGLFSGTVWGIACASVCWPAVSRPRGSEEWFSCMRFSTSLLYKIFITL